MAAARTVILEMATARAPGSDGTISVGGWLLDSGEKRAELRGATRWITYDNLIANIAIVASAIGVTLDLGGSAKWTAVPNPQGGADAKYAAELVQDGVIDVRMDERWRTAVVPRQLVGEFRGFAMHAKGWRRDSSGRIVLAELGHRPQWSIERWIKPTETSPWTGVVQRTRMGAEFPLERSDLLYSRRGALSDDPRGIGLLRHAAEVAEILNRYRQLQGIAFDTDCNGIPIGRAPLSKLITQATMSASAGGGGLAADDTDGINAYLATQTKAIRDLIQKRVVTEKRSLLLDSLPYFNTKVDGSQDASLTLEWSIDTVRQLIGSIPELGRAIGELNAELARLFSAEWMLLDGGGGAFAMHADKSNLYAARLNSWLDRIGDDGERDVVPDICRRNGITDERCWPSLQHEPISRTSIALAAQMLKDLHAAALKPGDPAENVLRARAELPPAPEPDEDDIAAWRAGRAGGKPSAAPADDEDPEEGDPEEGAEP